jgi:hypothetical protein
LDDFRRATLLGIGSATKDAKTVEELIAELDR